MAAFIVVQKRHEPRTDAAAASATPRRRKFTNICQHQNSLTICCNYRTVPGFLFTALIKAQGSGVAEFLFLEGNSR